VAARFHLKYWKRYYIAIQNFLLKKTCWSEIAAMMMLQYMIWGMALH
jgi:hypothetical protein